MTSGGQCLALPLPSSVGTSYDEAGSYGASGLPPPLAPGSLPWQKRRVSTGHLALS